VGAEGGTRELRPTVIAASVDLPYPDFTLLSVPLPPRRIQLKGLFAAVGQPAIGLSHAIGSQQRLSAVLMLVHTVHAMVPAPCAEPRFPLPRCPKTGGLAVIVSEQTNIRPPLSRYDFTEV